MSTRSPSGATRSRPMWWSSARRRSRRSACLLNSACAKHPERSGQLLGHARSLLHGSVPLHGLRHRARRDRWGSGRWHLSEDNHGGVYIPRFQNLDSVTHPKFKRGFNIQGVAGRSAACPRAPGRCGASWAKARCCRTPRTASPSTAAGATPGASRPRTSPVRMTENERQGDARARSTPSWRWPSSWAGRWTSPRAPWAS